MRDTECVAFLQWALPRLRMRWRGFRKVRRQVCRCVWRRVAVLGLDGLSAYRSWLEGCPEEWAVLDQFCRIPISRFFRDGDVFGFLERDGLPGSARDALSAGEGEVRIWSAGCAGGEEPYSLAMLWKLQCEPRFPGLALRIVATDSDASQLARARGACYGDGSLKEVPRSWREAAFLEREGRFCLRPEFRGAVEFREQDIRRETPDGLFHLVLCRNLAFTYFEEALQREIAAAIRERLVTGGLLVLGKHETLPLPAAGFVPLDPRWPVARAAAGSSFYC